MDHEDVLEQLELAAVEPGGLDRLVAGDTALAAAVVGHLAGCEPCSEEFRRLSRAAPLLRDLVRTTPPADLRERTLAFVQAHGLERGEVAIDRTLVPATGSLAGEPTAATGERPARVGGFGGRVRPMLPWAAMVAAVLALAVSGVSFLATRGLADQAAGQGLTISALERVERATLDLTAAPDGRRVELASTTGADTTGTILFSPSTAQLVVVAYELERLPSGQEYHCWVEIDGRREEVGRMFFADELAFWVGRTPEVSGLPAGATFGVSPTPAGGSSLEADPVITGEL